MIRNEDFFLKLWIDYYSRFVPRENLFILVDGKDSSLPQNTEGCQIITLPRDEATIGWDRRRWDFLSQFASSLTMRFDVVLGGDVDELITLDPQYGPDPIAFILNETTEDVIAPFAIEIIHRIDLEERLDSSRGILSQRSYGRVNTFYCKPSIIRKPVRWSLGQHFSSNPDRLLSDKLFLFHLKFIDHDMLKDRQRHRLHQISDSDAQMVPGIAGEGWYQTLDQISDQLQVLAESGPPRQVDLNFRRVRNQIKKTWSKNARGLWRHARTRKKWTFEIPERFQDVF